MKKVLSYVITFCLIAIVILMLMRNKKEINAQIAFAEKKVEAYSVQVTQVSSGSLDLSMEKTGILSAAEDLMVMAETQGRVVWIFKKEGEWIERGEIIAQVNDELMKAELMVTEANYEKAKKDLERAMALSEGGAITQQQLEGLQLNEKAAHAKYITSRKRVNDARIKAPISGLINKLFLKEGGMIGPGVPVCELVNIKTLKMSVKADEEEVVLISKGQEVAILVDAIKGEILSGKVVSIANKADYALQYGIEVVIPENPQNLLKAGMVARARFTFEDEEGPIIPRRAVIGSIKDPHVYVVNGEYARLRAIQIDQMNGEEIKVSEGLEIGEILVVAGHSNLSDQMKVKVIE